MTDEELQATQGRCDKMHALLADLATCLSLASFHQGRGDAPAVEASQQMVRGCVGMLQEHLDAIRKVALPLLFLLLLPLAARADAFDDALAALKAHGAVVKPATPSVTPPTALQQPRHGDTKPCTDGRGDWTYDASEGVWWRYRPDWIQPSAASLLESGGSLRPGVRRAAGGCLTGG